MPSPFPGMDPYLEDSSWSNFHGWLAPELARQLNKVLPDRYAALVNTRFIMVDEVDFGAKEHAGYPDVEVVREAARPPYRTGTGSAVLDPPLTLPTSAPLKMPHLWVEVIKVSDQTLVTLIEILSPWNKVGRGRDDYLRKRDRILASEANLVEIDLIRRGKRIPVDGDLPMAPYYVFLSRAGNRPLMGIWPIQLTEQLPQIPVPLEFPDPDAGIDLQTAAEAIYSDSRYERLIDYTQPPPPGPLSQAELQFIEKVLANVRKPGGKRGT